MKFRLSFPVWQKLLLLLPLVFLCGSLGFPTSGDLPASSQYEAAAIKHPPLKNPKLSTQIADLARAIPQRGIPFAPGESVTAPAGFSIATLPKSARDAIRAGQMKVSDKGEVQVFIEMSQITPEKLSQLHSFGVTVQILGEPKPDKTKGEVLAKVPTVQGMLPIEMINSVAALPFVRYIRLPDYGFTNTGSVESQGDAILQAEQARGQFGIDGTGVRVGVISDGIGGIFATGCTTCGPTTATPSPIALGDLPNATGTRNSTGVLTSVSGGIVAKSFRTDGYLEACLSTCDTTDTPQTGAEGTAMLEVVHDLAPGAQLYFANFDTSMAFQQAVDWLDSQVDVAVDDIGFFMPPFDGTSSVSTNTAVELNTDTNPVRGYFTSVGNQALNHYEEAFVDSGQDFLLVCPASQGGGSTVGDVQLFQATASTIDQDPSQPLDDPTDTFTLVPGQTVNVVLTWNDPSGASSNDYDLYLYIEGPDEATENPAMCSTNPQTGTQPPVESLAYTNESAATQQLDLFIQNVNNAAQARIFDMFVTFSSPSPLRFVTPSGSVPSEADAGGSPVSVVSVGATDAQTDASGDAAATAIEPYSSEGPTEATPQAPSRMKPDVIATDGVSITGAGGFGAADTLNTAPCAANNPSPPGCYFFGTSAAAPHAAAIAALILQAAPCLLSSSTVNTPATARTHLRNFMTSAAVALLGISQRVPNNIEGFGLLNALAAVDAAMPTATATAIQTTNGTSASGATVTLSGTGSDPDSCPLTLSWSGSCGTATGTSPSVTCPIGVDTETLTVSNGGASTGLPTSSVQIAVSDFTASPFPTGATVQPGQSVSYTITVSSAFGAFTNAVSLACSGLPSLSSCSFSPPTVTPGSGSAASMLTISTTAPSSVLPLGKPGAPGAPLPVLWLFLFFTLAAAGIVASKLRRKLAFGIGWCALVLLLVGVVVSCGGGGAATTSSGGTPAGTYSVTVTGTSNQLQHSTTVTLTVQ